MRMLWTRLAFRFIRRHRRKSLATGSFIIIGTAILIVMQGLTTGINDTMVTNTTRLHMGDLFLQTDDADIASSSAAAARDMLIEATVLTRTRFTGVIIDNGSATPLTVFAVDPVAEMDTTAIARRITAGTYPEGSSDILLGAVSARTLGLAVSDIIRLRGADGKPIKTFRLSGIFTTGIDHVDSLSAFVAASALGDAMPPGATHEVSVFIPDHDTTMVAELNEAAQGTFEPWFSLMPDLVQLIDLNRTSMGIIIGFVFILVGFGISNVSILTVVERFHEFGILKAMGVRPREVVKLVYLEGVLLFGFAAILGILVGWAAVGVMAVFGVDLSSFTSHNRYFVVTGVVHPRLGVTDMLITAGFAVLVASLASLVPARIAAKRTAMEGVSAR